MSYARGVYARLALVFVLLIGCKSSTPAAAGPEKPPAKGPTCSNACMERDSKCNEKCLDDDTVTPPTDEGDSCGGKCSKALEACVAACR